MEKVSWKDTQTVSKLLNINNPAVRNGLCRILLFLFYLYLQYKSSSIYDMKHIPKIILCFCCVTFLLSACRDKARSEADTAVTTATTRQTVKPSQNSEKEEDTHKDEGTDRQRVTDFIPKGYKLFQKQYGDLNKDGYIDCVLIIKATRKDGFVKDFKNEVVDRNRRGIIVLFNKEGIYEVASKNYTCFSSENEDGGAYISPELDMNIKNGKLYLHYYLGRRGYREYCFRYQDNDFALIGFESSSDDGPTVLGKTSINFLTRTKYTDININIQDDNIDAKFKRTVTKLKKEPLKKLSKITDFDELEFY